MDFGSLAIETVFSGRPAPTPAVHIPRQGIDMHMGMGMMGMGMGVGMGMGMGTGILA